MNIVNFQDIKLTHRNPLHSYTLTMRKHKDKLRKQSHSPLWQKEYKYWGINLPKETKDLHVENYKALMQEIKDDTNRWRKTPFHRLEESIQWKWVYYPKQSIDSIQSPSSYQW